MRTQEERVSSLHLRMADRRRTRERRKTGAISAASAVLTACLLLIIGERSFAHLGGTAGMYSGATMLFENAGAYVLVALLAFMIGAAAAVVLIRRRKASEDADTADKEEENEERRNKEEHL